MHLAFRNDQEKSIFHGHVIEFLTRVHQLNANCPAMEPEETAWHLSVLVNALIDATRPNVVSHSAFGTINADTILDKIHREYPLRVVEEEGEEGEGKASRLTVLDGREEGEEEASSLQTTNTEPTA